MHDNNIVHRDLKLMNVFVSGETPDGRLTVKIGDFGMALLLKKDQCM